MQPHETWRVSGWFQYFEIGGPSPLGMTSFMPNSASFMQHSFYCNSHHDFKDVN